jgi:CRISPR-associated protein Cmr6
MAKQQSMGLGDLAAAFGLEVPKKEVKNHKPILNFSLLVNKPIPSKKEIVKEEGRDKLKVTYIDNGLFVSKLNFFSTKDIKLKKYSLRDRNGEDKDYSRKNEIEGFNFEGINFPKLQKRQKAIAQSFIKYKEINNLSLQDKLAIGLGSASAYETGITLHPIYGIPFLPASSIKGIVRSWIITNVFKDEKDALQDKAFCDIFGCRGDTIIEIDEAKIQCKSFYKLNPSFKGDSGERMGNIIFLDAFPIHKPLMKVDIMTPHYSEWYSDGRTPPADYLSPVPIPFLTIQDTKFNFYLVLRDNYTESISFKNENKLDILDIASIWLIKALTEHGIGAKTAVGYGYMNEAKK